MKNIALPLSLYAKRKSNYPKFESESKKQITLKEIIHPKQLIIISRKFIFFKSIINLIE